MDNKAFAAAMRKEAQKWVDIIPVTKEQFLRIADRVEASADPKGMEPFKGFCYGEKIE